MKRCPNCNRAYSDMVKICSACGTDLSGNAVPVQPQDNAAKEQPKETRVVEGQVVKTAVQNNAIVDSGNILWGLPGFFVPIAGWLLYFVWKNKKPKTAKVANIGAWVGFVLGMLMNMAAM